MMCIRINRRPCVADFKSGDQTVLLPFSSLGRDKTIKPLDKASKVDIDPVNERVNLRQIMLGSGYLRRRIALPVPIILGDIHA